MKKIDMSEKAVMRRLKQVDQLRDLCLSLMKAKFLTNEEGAKLRKEFRERKAREASVKVD
ncbi:MAG: hypothetical protein KF855_18100 [Acidobacteria bacterium]|nr:hypothetical protein [Acidobacteriota bacterium]